jgi:hypothetical protein
VHDYTPTASPRDKCSHSKYYVLMVHVAVRIAFCIVVGKEVRIHGSGNETGRVEERT